MPDLVDPADLYQVDPAQFTATRNALVKRMRAEGRRDEAAEVATLRRPPVTAWALNQVARRQPSLIASVLDAGGRLRSAMEQAVGGDASGLRDARAAQRRAVDAAVTAAAARLVEAGHPAGDAARQRMVATLGAAAVDDAVAGQVRDGVLDDDRSAPGFGLDAVSIPGRPSARGTSRGGAAEGGTKARPSQRRTERDLGTPERGRRGGAPSEQGSRDHDEATERERRRHQEAAERERRREREAAERERARQARLRRAELKAQADRLARRAQRLRAQAEEAEGQATVARQAADAAEAEAEAARRAVALAESGED